MRIWKSAISDRYLSFHAVIEMTSKILMHICCGPCAVYPVTVLQERGYEVTGLFYNPNIHPLTEYLARAQSAQNAADMLGIRMIRLDSEYDPAQYLRSIVFREEQKCYLCCQDRLERTRNIAVRGKFGHFTSSLLFSKRQKHEQIQSAAQSLSKKNCLFLYEDFRQGWKQGRAMADEMGLYRQNYCGCIYSEYERFRAELGRSD